MYGGRTIARNPTEYDAGLICTEEESPIRRIWSPWGFDRAEFDFPGSKVEPVYIVIHKVFREIVSEYVAWNQL